MALCLVFLVLLALHLHKSIWSSFVWSRWREKCSPPLRRTCLLTDVSLITIQSGGLYNSSAIVEIWPIFFHFLLFSLFFLLHKKSFEVVKRRDRFTTSPRRRRLIKYTHTHTHTKLPPLFSFSCTFHFLLSEFEDSISRVGGVAAAAAAPAPGAAELCSNSTDEHSATFFDSQHCQGLLHTSLSSFTYWCCCSNTPWCVLLRSIFIFLKNVTWWKEWWEGVATHNHTFILHQS